MLKEYNIIVEGMKENIEKIEGEEGRKRLRQDLTKLIEHIEGLEVYHLRVRTRPGGKMKEEIITTYARDLNEALNVTYDKVYEKYQDNHLIEIDRA